MKFKSSLLLLPFLCISNFVNAQGESRFWYFGQKAGIQFTSTGPVLLNNSVMNADEGCSATSTQSGFLQFYSDGINVFNRYNQRMPNGFGLNGHSSATQGCLILPRPKNPFMYYIFTTDYQGNSNGACYSVVDMSAANRYGDVTTKNISLLNKSTEKIASWISPDQKYAWVLFHEWNSNCFYAYKVDSNGISNVYKTNIGAVHSGGIACNNAVGYMKFSPDGNKIALAIYNSNLVEIFDFNKNNGEVMNCRSFSHNTYSGAYGIEFSGDGSLLYVSYTGTSSKPSAIVQYDLQKNLASEILKSGAVVTTSKYPALIGALQNGPDGKIYVSRKDQKYLSFISFPNIKGSFCGFTKDGLYLGGNQCKMGLPQFPSNYFKTLPLALNLSLKNFEITTNENKIFLDWELFSNETGYGKFSIEKSYDGKKFKEIKRIDLLLNQTAYQAEDTLERTGDVYYRLLHDSLIIAQKSIEISKQENNFSDKIIRSGDRLSFYSKNLQPGILNVFNTSGIKVREISLKQQETEFTTEEIFLEPGFYLVNSDDLKTIKLVVR